jgi:hypothetical protein
MAEHAWFALYSCMPRHIRGKPRYDPLMFKPDLNLLVTLDVLLAEGSVARAARRLRLSPSAMSRALARLRQATGDPLLVRAGRGLVPTPRALELGGRVGSLVREAEAVLSPGDALDLKRLARTFKLRSREASSKISARPCSPASPGRRRACGSASSTSRTRTARRFATGASTLKRVWWKERADRSCARKPCSATASSASCAMAMHSAAAR